MKKERISFQKLTELSQTATAKGIPHVIFRRNRGCGIMFGDAVRRYYATLRLAYEALEEKIKEAEQK